MGRLKSLKLVLLHTSFNFLYQTFYKMFGPKKGRITLATMRSDQLNDNLKALHQGLLMTDINQIKIFCYHYDRTFSGKLGFLLASIKALYLIARSDVFVIDDYFFPLYAIHKHEDNQVVQLWHAIGSLKKFGLSLPDANQSVMRPHTNYDWVLINAKTDQRAYLDAMAIDEAHVLAIGSPMVDDLLNRQPQCNSAVRRILYSPTYRPVAQGKQQVMNYVKNMIDACQQLTGQWEIYISLHPYLKLTAMALPQNVHIFQDAEKVKTLMPTVDLFITDYSSLSLTFSYFERPILLYTPDYDTYMQTSGFYVDYYQYLKAPYFNQATQVVNYINNKLDHMDLSYVRHLKQKTFPHQDGRNTERVVQFVEKLTRGE
ncbi:ribitolphosphotransferase [Lactiplantibacillus paraplantarum]|uniref:Ribitolphosphotransferase n=1 Tax=Lactiplantibacillus paraplantarum TaxID=60520 RepID=A0A4Q9Y1I1_9LACO|nr:ribitolphosphotransferase [Lactiplantibacillus paraplantarum]